MTDIDNIVDKALDKPIKTAPRKRIEEPKHVLVYKWFKPWKAFKYETSSKDKAYDKFNVIMEQLSQCNNVIIDAKRSRVTMEDIAPVLVNHVDLKYVVEVYWRDEESI